MRKSCFSRSVAGMMLALAAATPVAHSAGKKTVAKPASVAHLFAPLDTSADACEDFYRHACGGFQASAALSEAHPAIDLANQQFEANLERSFDKLFADNDPVNIELARVKTFYRSCLTDGASDHATVKEWLARIDGAQSPAAIQSVLMQLSAIGVDTFFSYSAQPDRKQWDRYRGELHNSYLWASEPVVLQTFLAAGMPDADARREAASVAAIVAVLRKARADRYDASTAENPLTLAEVAQLAPSIDWMQYFSMVGAAPGKPVNVTSPAYLQAVEKELATRSSTEMRALLRWSFLFSLRGELPAPYNAAFGNIIPPLRVQLGNPAGRCRDATVRAMGVEFSRQYATHVLGLKAREAAQKIAADIKTRIVASVEHAQWLSPAGRRATSEKLSRTDLKIGFPDAWPEVGNYPLSSTHFLANVLAARRYEQQREWARVALPHSRTAWDMIVSPWVGDGMAAARLVVPNGFPDAFSNSIIMTAAYLGAPRFDANAPLELNYATFGAVLGHEFVHVAELHMFGADGREVELWSDEDIKAEAQQGQCVIDQANAHEPLPGVQMKGERQYAENVADYGGLRLAFEALEARLGTERLYAEDGSGTSPARRFFYRFAQNRCTAETDAYLRKSVEADGHAPSGFRVNAPLSNLPGFARAFHCGAGAKMTRPAARQCRVW